MIGLPFSFAYHFAPQLLDPALETYRSNFRPPSSTTSPGHGRRHRALRSTEMRPNGYWVVGLSSCNCEQDAGRPSFPEEARRTLHGGERAIVEDS